MKNRVRKNEFGYVSGGEYCILALELLGEGQPIEKCGRMQCKHLKRYNAKDLNPLVLEGMDGNYLEDINNQQQSFLQKLI